MKTITWAVPGGAIILAVAICGIWNRPVVAESPAPTSTGYIDEELRCEILYMKDLDQAARFAAIKARSIVEALVRISQELDVRHTNRMKQILAQYGWPDKSLVGEDGAFAAWLLVQHATHDVKFMEDCLVLMQAAAEKGEASRKDVAYLIDRVRIRQHKPQLYGTQFKGLSDEEWTPEPIEDEEQVDERRKSVGLSTMVEQMQNIRQAYVKPTPSPN
ncbi:MAG TPA: DUF6624 domain-containing protein [Pirellulales bacterium]|jgi:hypothetical protein|nr:DUF6624 domain-containing protein [Pirellulales bacterium]